MTRHQDTSFWTDYAHDADEAQEFDLVASQLGLAERPVAPPARLKTAIFDALPEQDDAPTTVADPAPPVVDLDRVRRLRRRVLPATVAAAAAAALVIAGVSLGGALNPAQPSPTPISASASTLARIVSEPDVARVSAAIAGSGTATLVTSRSLGRAAVIVDGAKAAPAGHVYELWYLRDGSAHAAGTFSTDGSGAATAALRGQFDANDHVAITVEPTGGSKQPTSAPVVVLAPEA